MGFAHACGHKWFLSLLLLKVKFIILSELLKGGPGTLITSAPRQNYVVNYDYNHYFMCPGSST